MNNVTFFILENKSVEIVTCSLIEINWKIGNHAVVFCETKKQAMQIDEILWQKNNSFIPHNLVSEQCTYKHSPIEICWPQQMCIVRSQKTLLINLVQSFSIYVTLFKEVVDFAPYQNDLKILARNRYRKYIKTGFHLQHKKI